MTDKQFFGITNSISDWGTSLLRAIYEASSMNINHIYIAIGVSTTILTVIGIAILWNQRKIKKQLRQLLEQKEETNNQEPSSSPGADNS